MTKISLFNAIILVNLAVFAAGHGVVTQIRGANGVTMPGLSVIDGTPRDCATPACGAEADTSIIRQREIASGKASALGRTKGGGPVDAAKAIASFMGPAAAAPAAGNATAKRGLLGGLLGGGGGGAGSGDAEAGGGLLGGGLGGGLLGGNDQNQNAGAAQAAGTKTPKGTVETGVKAAAGKGATSGLPTASDTGVITMTYHQVNQDGAGSLTAQIDPTSGGTDPAAFQNAQVIQDVPGGNLGLSLKTATDFPIKVQMPAGMTCSGTVGGAKNVCIVRVHNNALAGPFGGSAAFTQSPAAAKRSIEERLRTRHFVRGVLGVADAHADE